MGAGDFGDVARPVFPMVAVATFFDNFGVEGAFDFADFELEAFLYWRGCGGAAYAVASLGFA